MYSKTKAQWKQLIVAGRLLKNIIHQLTSQQAKAIIYAVVERCGNLKTWEKFRKGQPQTSGDFFVSASVTKYLECFMTV